MGRPQKRADDDAFTENKGSITRRAGMTDSVRLVWVGSMHRRADIREAMTTLTYMKHNTSEQHVELTLRGRRDMKSMEKIMSWFDTHNPFDLTTEALRSLYIGLTTLEGYNINCDHAENVWL